MGQAADELLLTCLGVLHEAEGASVESEDDEFTGVEPVPDELEIGVGVVGIEKAVVADVDEGLSHHEVGRRFGIDRRTVKKMLSYSAPPGYRRTKSVRRPKLDGFTGIVDAILEADTDPTRAVQAVLHGAPDF